MNSGSPADIKFNAWLAGFIDGDGCIHFSYYKNNGRVAPRISIGNSHLPTMTYIIRKIGFGKIIIKKPDGIRHQKKIAYSITYVGLQAKEIAIRIYPYLIQKKKQCELIFKFKPMIPGKGTDKRTHKKQLKLVDKMKALNK